MRVVGIDPGSIITGYGIIENLNGKVKLIASGNIILKKYIFAERLVVIFRELSAILHDFKPDAAAIEKVFVDRNVNSALKLGEARGVAILALANHGLKVAEYASRAIKLGVVGYGNAEKFQVQRMIQLQLALSFMPGEDEADALAAALYHSYNIRILQKS